jgi:DNA-binding XRE family transcriptional regulator
MTTLDQPDCWAGTLFQEVIHMTVEAKPALGRPNRLRELREHWLHLTLEELALLVGVDATTLSRHESGSRSLSAEMVERYARVFKKPSWEIFLSPDQMGGEEDE